jgi:hypothetical protein
MTDARPPFVYGRRLGGPISLRPNRPTMDVRDQETFIKLYRSDKAKEPF